MLLKSLLLTVITLSIREVGSIREAELSDTCRKSSQTITKVINSLGVKLEGQIEGSENYFFSPFSITVALAMVYIGARGSTKAQMSEVLKLSEIRKNCLPNKISEDFRQLISSLQSDEENYTFLTANAAFVQTNFQISPYYSEKLQKYFYSNVENLNFAKDEIGTLNTINEWVSNSTNGKIHKVLNEPLDRMTIMVLMNAVYFKGIWDVEFDEKFTRDSIFYGVNDTSKTVKFMEMEDKFYYYFDDESQYAYLELDYHGRNTSMIIILPKNNEIPNSFLGTEVLCVLRSKLQLRAVSVSLPKFSMEFNRELSKDMKNLGMDELFSDRADLSGIREELHVSLMVHKAVIDINEKGSEAAAVSGVGIDSRNKVNQKVEFKANHPFSFYIVHRETDTILFSGRVLDL